MFHGLRINFGVKYATLGLSLAKHIAKFLAFLAITSSLGLLL